MEVAMILIFPVVAFYMGYETAFKTDMSKIEPGPELDAAKRKNKLIGFIIMVISIILFAFGAIYLYRTFF